MIGTNPRLEATILNARIRKAYVKNNTQIYSLVTQEILRMIIKLSEIKQMIKKIINKESEFSKKLLSAKNPSL